MFSQTFQLVILDYSSHLNLTSYSSQRSHSAVVYISPFSALKLFELIHFKVGLPWDERPRSSDNTIEKKIRKKLEIKRNEYAKRYHPYKEEDHRIEEEEEETDEEIDIQNDLQRKKSMQEKDLDTQEEEEENGGNEFCYFQSSQSDSFESQDLESLFSLWQTQSLNLKKIWIHYDHQLPPLDRVSNFQIFRNRQYLNILYIPNDNNHSYPLSQNLSLVSPSNPIQFPSSFCSSPLMMMNKMLNKIIKEKEEKKKREGELVSDEMLTSMMEKFELKQECNGRMIKVSQRLGEIGTQIKNLSLEIENSQFSLSEES